MRSSARLTSLHEHTAHGMSIDPVCRSEREEGVLTPLRPYSQSSSGACAQGGYVWFLMEGFRFCVSAGWPLQLHVPACAVPEGRGQAEGAYLPQIPAYRAHSCWTAPC